VKVTVEIRSLAGIIAVFGDINLYEIQILREEFEKIRQKDLNKIILDLTEVDFIDSSGIGLLIAQSTKFQEKKVEFILVGIKSGLEHLFRLTSFARLFKRYPEVNDALES
jgi:stage II sporulation protein AA (anti-sigma F factor antagonist)